MIPDEIKNFSLNIKITNTMPVEELQLPRSFTEAEWIIETCIRQYTEAINYLSRLDKYVMYKEYIDEYLQHIMDDTVNDPEQRKHDLELLINLIMYEETDYITYKVKKWRREKNGTVSE